MALLVSVTKMTGESCEMQAQPGDTVRELSRLVATELQVPGLAQKLWIHDASPTVVDRVLPSWCEKLEELLAPMSKRDIQEMKAFMRPPQDIVRVLTVVKHLVDYDPNDREEDWKACMRMMQNPSSFLERLRQASHTMQAVSQEQVDAAEAIINDMDFTRENLGKKSACCQWLVEWTLEALKLYRATKSRRENPEASQSLELQSYQRLELFAEGGKVQVVLVVDYDGVFKALNFHQSTTEALEALEVVASKCLGEAIPRLARLLLSGTKEHRHGALRVVKCLEPSTEWSNHLARQQAFSWQDALRFPEPLQAIEHLGFPAPDSNFFVFRGLNTPSRKMPRKRHTKKGRDNSQELGEQIMKEDLEMRQQFLACFKRLEPQLEPKELIDELMMVLMMGSAVQPELATALQVASERDYDYAVERAAQLLAMDQSFVNRDRCDRGVRAHAAVACAGFVKKEDARVLAAFQQCLEHELDGPDVQMLASSYSKISETPNPFVALLTAQLRTDQAYAALGVLQEIVAVDDENFIQFILQYLKKAESIIVDDEKGVEILVLAANCLKSKVTSQEIFVNATTTVLRAFILRVCRATFSLSYKSLQTQACRRAIELLAKTRGGATDEELQLIADGFTCGVSCSIGAGRDASDGIGMLCRKLFINISKAPEVDCVPMLLRVLHDDCLCEAKLHAVQALAALAPRDVVVPKLLELLESELMLKMEALELLEQYKEDVEVQRSVSKLLSHPDPSVRLAALRVTAPAAGLPEALEDSYSAVVLYALSEITAATTDVKALSKLLEHVDGKVRLHTTRLLGQASDKELAKEALQRGSTWPEIDSAVLEAREVALRSLEQ